MARDDYKVPELVYAPARRGASNILTMLVGTWGSGKTRSALELATGLAEGGPICLADTENGRALAYADKFKFDHLPLKEPFRPELFEQAAIVAQAKGAKVWICDNFSWEHIGPGGMLQWFEAELRRMAGDDWQKRERVKMTAWIEPKAAHGKMLQRFWQLNCHIILNVQAKKKIEILKDPKSGKMVPQPARWEPNCGEDVPYAMSTAISLSPDRPGVPVILKHHDDLDPLIPLDRPLTADVGRAFAAWARGETVTAPGGQSPPGQRESPPGNEPRTDAPDDGPDLRMIAWAENLAAAYLNTADAAAHFRLVDDKDNQTRLLWIRKNVPGLFSRTLKPAIDASFIRTGVAKTAAPPIQTAPDHGVSDPPPTEPELEELPL